MKFNEISFLLFLVFLVSCNNSNTSKRTNVLIKNENNQDVKVPLRNDFENQLFITATSLDDNGDLELGCDCCSSNFYFIDKSKFIEVAYCLHEDSYLKGNYEIVKDGVMLRYDQEYLNIETNLEINPDSTETWKNKYIYRKSDGEGKVSWKKNKSNSIFKTSFGEYARIDNSKTEFLKRISADSKVKTFLRM
ncbi:hypothetical protein LZZ90_08005 [Flavobacterium sp. SM15]|uniref:hypothetical protein n=1 Tax=Flavobacterium sp. SM15 TaxID=2908005 RepID=UPI001EDB46FD|nr:hypothetical protein [Flavobacterium sp. SM15]MCG2611448.1 hypothetical protein [Flavobacterium sp. SM15]